MLLLRTMAAAVHLHMHRSYSQKYNTCTTLKTAMLSACRIGQHGDWQLKFEDPSTDHPNGKFICEACEAAAERDWDPCEEYHRRRDAEAERLEAEDCWNEHRGEEDTEEGGSEEGDDDDNDEGKEEVEKLEDWEGVADVHHLRQHAATRQHILNMQVYLLVFWLWLACL